MLSFLKKIFGAVPTKSATAPYKVENTVPQVAEFPFPSAKPAQTEEKPVAKKTVAKKSIARRPRKTPAPKA